VLQVLSLTSSNFLFLFFKIYLLKFVSLIFQSSRSFLSLYDRNDVRLIGLDDAATRLGIDLISILNKIPTFFSLSGSNGLGILQGLRGEGYTIL
jgi:hypothetical protein